MTPPKPGVFGTWDAPVTDDLEPIAVPTRMVCMYCRERFRKGDNGAILESGWPAHRECSLRSVMGGIGHIVNHAHYCTKLKDPDGGLTYRQSAILVWRWHQRNGDVTEKTLEEWRGRA